MKIGINITKPLMPGQYILNLDPARSVGIERVIFNAPATIVIWKDGSKTVVKCAEEDFDHEKGLAMAIAKKALGNKGSYYSVFKKWLPDISGEDTDVDKELYVQLKVDLNTTPIKKVISDIANDVNNFTKRFCKDNEEYVK